ncbi:MAG TPA: Fe-S-containing protein [Nitrospirota bacterium]|nr:Fe-S-containing protein [Nitrospirota bacterium]
MVVSLVLFILPACSRQASYPSPMRIGPDIVIDTSVLQIGVPKFYTYLFQGKRVNFFVVKMEDRTLSFLDACVSCYPHKKGYRCEDNAVICRNCNVRLPISKLEKGIGNCYPIKIEGRMEKGMYLISADILEKAANKF